MGAPGGGWGRRRYRNRRRREPPACPVVAPGCGGARERGSAVVDFVLVGGLLTMFFLAIIQLTLVLHIRNTLIDAAASGARYGTLADRNSEDARARTAQLIGMALNPDFATDVSTSESTYQGIRTLQVTVRAPLPVIGLIGPRALLEVSGHAAIQR
ncbi:TadE family protein [Pseudarthrobacter sp. H2]|uniref:TadE family protein n=1 Tax=Pseudarthrobacter sp. H2 TaxID=3418415 RepID=UPI003CEA3CFD